MAVAKKSLAISIVLVLAIGLGFFAASLGWLPFSLMRSQIDRFSGDGSADPYTPELHLRLQHGMMILGSLLIVLPVVTYFAARTTVGQLAIIRSRSRFWISIDYFKPVCRSTRTAAVVVVSRRAYPRVDRVFAARLTCLGNCNPWTICVSQSMEYGYSTIVDGSLRRDNFDRLDGLLARRTTTASNLGLACKLGLCTLDYQAHRLGLSRNRFDPVTNGPIKVSRVYVAVVRGRGFEQTVESVIAAYTFDNPFSSWKQELVWSQAELSLYRLSRQPR